ncbi:hypothetical protein ACLOAU_24115 [Niabella sp. CJ426]|jgi:multidrug resistance efflux pump|uniref:hypothetical protein n=1 Tax=Niabella sp. CJ426 TaxID=3393740 RepID=UPI003D05DE9F
MENQKGGFFSGLKKMIFKEEDVPLPAQQPEPTPAKVANPVVVESRPANTFDAGSVPVEAREDAAKKAYQLIESINQPGVDFFEVWNAVEESGGAQAASLKQAFNTLKFADKTLTKEKLLSSGNYYKNELQKALDSDVQKKNSEKAAITNKIKESKETLAAEVNSLEEQVIRLQKTIAEKQAELSNLQAHWQPKLEDIEKKIQTGKHAIEGVISKMQTLLGLAEKEL